MNDREKLNQLGEKWYKMPEQGNEAARLTLCEEIFILAYKLFPRQSDAIGLFFVEDWSRFDPGKGDLYGFMSFRLKKRMEDLNRQDSDGMWREEVDAVTGKTRRVKMGHDSLDALLPNSEDSKSSLMDRIPSAAGNQEADVLYDADVLELMALMLNLKTRLGLRNDPSVRINYYRLFFTDEIADAIQYANSVKVRAFARRERDLFTVLKVSFLNFCMRSTCSCVEDIRYNDWKLYGQIVKGRAMKPPKKEKEVEKEDKKTKKKKKYKILDRFLPLDVYTTYLKQVEHRPVGKTAIDNHRKEYEKFMREQLQC